MSITEKIRYQQPGTVPLKPTAQARYLWERIVLGLILLLSAVLNFWSLNQMGYSNAYYSAAVKSMLQNWHAFFFASLDPVGFVTVDKPPLDLWLQVLSAKIFGYSGVSLILPQAIAGVISVGLMYYLVRRVFGSGAGLLAALVLAITPISVVVSRNNIVDSVLILTLMLGAWAVLRAAETGRVRWLLLCAVFVGLGFNVKMLQAYLVVPAFGLVYLLGAPHGWWKRILHLSLAVVVLLVISLSWSVAVDLTPASQRPYVGSSQTNSELELAFGYNGLERLIGMSFGRNFGGRDSRAPSPSTTSTPGQQGQTGVAGQQGQPGGFPGRQGQRDRFDFRGQGAGPGGGGMFGTGQAGPLRLFTGDLAEQASWLLPLALIGMIVAAWQQKVRLPLTRRQQSVVLWGIWLLTTSIFFSVAGFIHTYYLATMAPAIAALAGIGIMVLWKEYRSGGWRSWLLPGALLVTAGVQLYMLSSYQSWNTWLAPIIAGLSILSALAFGLAIFIPRLRVQRVLRPAITLGVIALLIVPSAWSVLAVVQHNGGMVPSAGPVSNSLGGGVGGTPEVQVNQKLVQYLEAHQGNAPYLLAVTNANSAAPYIISTGKGVMALGGFSGSDNILTTQDLANLVKNGMVRYFMLGGGVGGQGGSSSLTSWVQSNCSVVPGSQWQSSSSTSGNGGGGPGFGGSQTLYACGSAK